MANPLESQKLPFSPAGPIERRPVDPGRLEPDDFIINDIPLRIPPTHIHVEKKAFNREWQTLRTNSSQKVKSGHSIARVSFVVEFVVSDSTDLLTMTSLIAGLRATPFAVAHNLYLDRTLGRPDDTTVTTAENKRYKNFKPIMLALASMTFESCGHERTPDKIKATFDFVWFNYLPFTNMIAFKAGEDAARPGHPWESELWKRFYAPFENVSEPVSWPHETGHTYARTTEFHWREFLSLPKGDPMSAQATADIINAIRKNPKTVLSSINSGLAKDISSDAPNPANINEGVYDAVYRRLVKEGHINISQAMQNYLDKAPNGSITKAGVNVLSPLIKKLNQKSGISKSDLEEVDFAAALMAGRLKKMKGAQSGEGEFNPIEDGDYVKLLDADTKYEVNKKDTFVAGMELFGRKRRYKIAHVHNPVSPPDMIVTRIAVSFENILATIPMVGYRYPTIQHIGSIDARVSMTIDANNKALGDLNQMYDSIETNALRYKQIPQGLNNLWINNDFLRMFGLSEFVTEAIGMDTMPGSPGRSLVSFSCVEAGVTSKTRLADSVDSQEKLQQENIQSSGSLRQSVWKELWKSTMVRSPSEPKHDVGMAKSVLGYIGEGFGISNDYNTATTDVTSAEYYTRRVTGIPADKSHEAYRTLVQAATSAYNDFLMEVHKQIFDPFSSAPGVSGSVNAGILMNLHENDPNEGLIPGLEAVKQSVKLRNKAYYAANRRDKTRDIRVTEDKEVKALGKARNRAGKLLANENINSQKQDDQLLKRSQRINDLGVRTYQARIRKLLDDITSKHLELPELQKFRIQIEKEGLQKGLMAYPDFRPQLASVAAGLEGSALSDAQIMKYDPDCYFWYPTYDGAQASPLNGFVDEHYILEAKRHSRSLASQAQEAVGGFFQNTYLKLLKSDANPGPHDALVKRNNASQMADAFFTSSKIANATRNTGSTEPITKTFVPDGGTFTHTNWYGEDKKIQSKHLCNHSVNIDQLWDGVDVSADADNYRASQPGTDPNMILPNEGGADGYAAMNHGFTRSPNTPNFAWPVAKAPTHLKPSYRFGSERSYRNGTHNGIDVPEHTQAKKPYGVRDGIYGDPVLAAAAGKVRWIRGPHRNGGLRIGIDHGNGWTTDYMHLQEGSPIVKTGQNVEQGQRIAHIGRTGVLNRSCATHLHFAVRYRGQFVDPLKVLPPEDVLALNAGRYNPTIKSQARLSRIAQTQVKNSPTDTGVSPLRASIEEFEKSLLNGQGQSMMRAYPTFKLYFIEDDSGERKRLAYDDFFSYNSVQSIRVIRSRKIAADMCELYLTNISGTLSNRKFRQEPHSERPRTSTGEIAEESTHVMRANTAKENPIASLLLQEGIQISLRLGYSSDPDRLDTVFNGVITEVQFSESDDMVRIIAQSHALELVQSIKGLEKPQAIKSASWAGFTEFWGFGNKASTGRILEEMLANPEVVHFGRWNASTDERNAARELLTQRWTYEPQPVDDNIFAPDPESEFKQLSNEGGVIDAAKAAKNTKGGILAKAYGAFRAYHDKWQYVIYRTTIWDICQEMTRRHPNFICSAVPYKGKGIERMTLFYGLPNQLYFARDPSASEEFADERMKKQVMDSLSKILENAVRNQLKRKDELQHALFGTGWTVEQFVKDRGLMSPDLGKAAIGAAIRRAGIKINNKTIPAIVALAKENPSILEAAKKYARHKRLELARAAGYIKPFRNYHLVTSAQHIISNNIQATSRNVANHIVIKYGGETGVEGLPADKVATKSEEQMFSLKLDNALPDEDLRTQMGQFVNVTNPELAKRYALSMLCDNVKEIYKGDLCTIGNGKVKPYDVVYMVDEYTDMIGAFEVEEVQHIFDQNHGFRTEIKPDMLVQAAEWSLLGSSEAMGVVMEGALHKLMGSDGPPASTGGKTLSFMANMMGRGVAMVGGFMSQKILNYTQLGQPLVMSPLLHHGRVFAGGVPTRKIPTSLWTTIMGDWNNNVDTGFDMAMEDAYDAVANWITTAPFSHTTGKFWNND